MSVTAKINKDLLKWSKDALSPWQHEAFRRILAKGLLTDRDKNEIYERAQIDLGFAVAPTPPPNVNLTDADLPSATTHANRVWLIALKDLENVNALKPKQRLAVGKQLTVVYGENGSGKSGYARVLKKTARCTEKAVENILSDVFQTSSPFAPAKAVFELDKGTGPLDVHWQDGQLVADDLKRFAVFDSKCARHFLDSSNQLSFAPAIFDSLEALGKITAEIKQRFLNLARQSMPATPPVYQFMVDQTIVGKALAGISVSSDPSTFTQLGLWTEQDDTILTRKETELKRLQTLTPQAIRQQLNREKRDVTTIQAKVGEVVTVLNETAIEAFKQLVANVSKYEEAFQVAVKLAFSNSTIEGVGTDAWKSLIEAAAFFSVNEVYKNKSFPPVGIDSVCVLCQQPLKADAATRLKSFWDFLQNDAAKKRDEAKRKLKDAIAKLQSIPNELPPTVGQLREDFEKNHSLLWQSAVELFSTAPARAQAIERAVLDGSWKDIPLLDDGAVALSGQLISTLEDKLKTVQDDIKAQEEIQKLASEVRELNARKRLSENLPLVLNYITGLQSSTRANGVGESIATNSISLKAKNLHKTFITDAFNQGVKEQMKLIGLGRARVSIDERSERGKVLHSIAVEGAKQVVTPENIFSEGERTAISLSFFLADLGSAEDTSGVIFDDPVTSLDHRIREGAINALVAETKQRQVIVFTHDLAFYCELISAATVAGIEVISNHVESFNKIVGQLSGTEPREALKVTQRYAELEKLVKDAELSSNSDDFRNFADRFYSLLRAAWERSVEELLFNQAVARYQKEVMTQRLVGVAIDTDSIAAVFKGMTHGSDRTDAHDHAPGTVMPAPSVEDLKAHLQELKDFVITQVAKRKAAEKQNEHLKG